MLAAVAIVVLLLAAGGTWWWFNRTPDSASADASKGDAKDGKKPGGAGKGGRGNFATGPQPVAAATARKGDIRIVQTSLGTVTAFSTVTVRARVDGPLMAVHFREGQSVKAGDILAQIDPAPFEVALSQAEGTLARDMAQLQNARVDLERYRTLLKQDSIASQQVDGQEAIVKQFEGTVKVDRAVVDNAKLQLSYTKVAAPIGGRTGLRLVDAGNTVHPGDAAGLVVITQINPITTTFTIPQDSLPRLAAELRRGDKIEVEAWDREQKNKLATGVLITPDNQVDLTTGTVKLKAQFPNDQGALFPNQFVNVRMVVDVRKDVTVIPSAAVQTGPQGTVVYAVKEDGTVSMRPIKLGPAEGEFVMVESGVNPGDKVVTDGIDRLREGAKVEVVVPTVPGPGGRGGAGKGGFRKGGDGAKPGEPPKPGEAPKAGDAPKAAAEAPRPAPGGDAGKPAGVPDPAKVEAARERFRNASPEEREKMREEFKKRMESASPEERERMMEMRKRREAQGQ
ncbi:multidrug transporter subunit MdtA [Betaproteobacteria bacterium GR16-43]|nr:multidrug transporter subunit MdtA [Betaproteobacteria bacterium GR16-43]